MSQEVLPQAVAAIAPFENRGKAMVLFFAGVGLLATMDLMVKLTSSHLSAPQIVWGRYMSQNFALVAITGLGGVSASLRSRLRGLHLARALLLFIANAAFTAALRYMPLADATVAGFASPLILTALTLPILGEKVTIARWAAVAIGFAGVLIVVQPGTSMFQASSLLPLLTAISSAFYYVLTPVIGRTENPVISIYYLSAIGSAAMSLAVPWFWTRPSALEWLMLGLIGALGTAGHFLLMRAFAYAPVSILAPFFYIHLIWAAAYGWLIFGDLPAIATVAGGALIVASGIYVYRSK